MITAIQDAVRLLLPHRRKTNATSGWISFNAPCCVHNGETADTRGRGGMVLNADGGTSTELEVTGRSGNAQGTGSWTNPGQTTLYGMANVNTTTASGRTDIQSYAVYIK